MIPLFLLLVVFAQITHLFSRTYYRDHNYIKEDIMKKHEAKLEELENFCHNSSGEYGEKLNMANKQINEREVYLARAQELLSSKYK